MVALAHELRMKVVAEGVESASQLEILNEMGCDEVQGYLLSLPLDAAAFADALRGRQQG
ncbi:EAL domain protein [compost metagenome]